MDALRFLKQTAVLWAGRTIDTHGKPSFADPVEILCRWEERQEKFVDSTKRELLSRAVVLVDRPVLPGEYLWLGKVEDLPETDPLLIPAAYEIRATGNSLSVKGEITLRRAWL